MGFFLFLEGEFFWIGHAMLRCRVALRALSPVGGFKRKEYVLEKDFFCNKGTLTNKFVGAFITKKTPALYAGATYSFLFGGRRGIRTPGTLIEYVSLANWWFQPLTHPS